MLNPRRSVGTKLFLIFFCFVVLSVAFVGTLSYVLSKKMITDKVLSSSEETITQAAEKMDLKFGFFLDLTNQMIANSKFQDNLFQMANADMHPENRLQRSQEILATLDQMALANKQIRDVSLFAIDDPVPPISTIRDNFNATKDDAWIKPILAADGKAVWLPIQAKGYFGTAAKPVFAYAINLGKNNIGSNNYVLIIQIEAVALQDMISNVSISSSSEVQISTPEGVTILSNRAGRQGEKNDLLQTVSPKTNSGKFINAKDQLVAFHASKSSNWVMIGTAPMQELTKDTQKIALITIWTVIGNVIVAILIGLMMMRMIGKPLILLRSLMMEGALGRLSGRTAFKGKDEIGQVGGSFNQMMEQITLLVKQTSASANEVVRSSSTLNMASKETAIAAQEINLASEQIAIGAQSMAVDAERGNAIVTQMGSQLEQVISLNETMGTAANEVNDVCRQGGEHVGQLIQKTTLTEEKIRFMTEKVEKLKSSTASIQNILQLLTNIARQTNILSINAAIEAARAGNAGKGFMVVADEIRTLADQSKKSIEIVKDITNMIQLEMAETVSALLEASPFFQEQIVSVREMDKIFQGIQSQMNGFVGDLGEVTESLQRLGQTQGVLNAAMSNVSAVSEESSATSEQVASLCSAQLKVSDDLVELAESLDHMSIQLKQTIDRFEI